MKRKSIGFTLVLALTLGFAILVWAAVPPPPVNQNLGLVDTMLNALEEADCRVCHTTSPPPGIPTDTTYLPDRHHLNVGTTITVGSCQETPNACQVDSECYNFCDLDPVTACTVDADCAGGATGPCVTGENYCVGDSQAPNATLTSPASGLFECLTCHTLIWDPVTMTSQFAPFRDCFICHTVEFQPDHPDRTQEANVHHRTGEAPKGNCAYCHGSLVDSGLEDNDSDCDAAFLCGDGTTACVVDADCAGIPDGYADTVNAPWVPTYQPSLVTPWPSGKNFGRCDETCDVGGTDTCSVSGDPCVDDTDCVGSDTQCVSDLNCNIAGEVCNLDLNGGGGGLPNARGTEEGNCNYCHDSSTTDTCDEVAGTCVAVPGTACEIDADCNGPILINHDTHHFTGATGLVPGGSCWFCHPVRTPTRTAADMRACETCHGIPSLHNIQVDSQPDGSIDPGAEDAYFGHIGNNTDCNGCHGFSVAFAPESGPVIPDIASADDLTMMTGADTTVTLTGSGFTNTVMGGAMTLTSEVELTASDGSTTTLIPDSVTESEIVVALSGSLAAGNYDLRAVKGPKSSNPVVVSVSPEIKITTVKCMKRRGRLVIFGSGFGQKMDGTEEYINLEVNGETASIISWRDRRIMASVSDCASVSTVTVNALYGSVESDSKPPKPGKRR